jgi:translation initiation factor 3 subunit H
LKIVKHCHESLPHMVTGSVLGLSVGKGLLEITHSFPFPDQRSHSNSNNNNTDEKDVDTSGLDGDDFQMEMMRMLREVNVDNNCVGWYQSMYLGIYSTSALLENQLAYQTDLSPNAVVILYDPMQTTHGSLVLKCYRLTEACLQLKSAGSNAFIDPRNIFEQVPVTLTNPGLVQALLTDVADGLHATSTTPSPMMTTTTATTTTNRNNSNHDTDLVSAGGADDCTFDRLDLSTDPYLEKHLEFLSSWVEDLATEQQKFQYYSRQLSRGKPTTSNKQAWASAEAPRRMESLLIANQIRSYCEQVNKFTAGGLGKLYLMGGLHKKEERPPATL